MNETSARIANILLVDDHGDSLLFMSMLLNSAGYSTATAVNLAEARELCRSTPFDLVITEADLPDGNGMALLSQIPQVCPSKGIVVSGDSEDLYEHLGLREPWSDYLLKPIRFGDLLAAVKRALSQTEPTLVASNLH